MGRIEKLRGVVLDQVKGIVKSGSEWKRFLDSASYTNKYPFENQLLIHAQGKEVTAVAEFDLWNDRFGRGIKRGTKGIPIVEVDERGERKLKYVFDIGDTYFGRETGNDVELWAFDTVQHADLVGRLEVASGITYEEHLALSYEEQIERYVDNTLNVEGIVESVEIASGRLLSEAEAKSVENVYRQSLSYMVMKRMGLDADFYYSEKTNDFDAVDSLSGYSFVTLNELTTSIMKVYTAISLDVSREISEMDIEFERNKVNRINSEKDLHETSPSRYSMDIEKERLKSNASDVEIESDSEGVGLNEGSDGRGIGVSGGERGLHADGEGVGFRETWGNVHDGERDSLSEGRMGRGNEVESDREVRESSEDVLVGSETVSSPNDGLGGDVGGSSGGSGQTGEVEIGNDDGSDDAETGSNGGTEGAGSDEMGPGSERNQEDVRRSDLRGTDSRLENGDEEQLDLFGIDIVGPEAVEEFATAFSVPENNVDRVLKSGSGIKNGKFRIAEFYETNPTNAEKVAFLKKEYGSGGRSNSYERVWYDSKGLRIEFKHEDQKDEEINLKWPVVARRLDELISRDAYLNDEEKVELIERRREREGVLEAEEIKAREYDLVFDVLPEGTVVYDRNMEVAENKFEEIAHISNGGIVSYYFNNLPDDVEDEVERFINKKHKEVSVSAEKDETLVAEEVVEEVTEVDPVIEREYDLIFDVLPEGTTIYDRNMEVVKNHFEEVAHISTSGVISYYVDDLPGDVEEEIDRFVSIKHKEVSASVEKEQIVTVEESVAEVSAVKDREFDLGFGHLGNGISVWNRNKEINRDYEKVAHISESGEVRYHIDDLPEDVKEEIVEMAKVQEKEKKEDIKEKERLEKAEAVFLAREAAGVVAEELSEGVKVEGKEKEIKASAKKENLVVSEELVEGAAEKVERVNFRIEDDLLGVAGPKEKYRWNIEALQTLSLVESENRLATPEEQEILSRYVGWGGLADVFDESKTVWSSEYEELKALLTEEEYASARSSTLNAHYTSPVIIKSMYQAVENMGFDRGNILEPSVGVGNFFGLLPESMDQSNLYGVELDDLTGRMTKQLYQKSDITIDGFENTDLPDNFFDVAVGNVPFGQYKVSDKKYDKNNFMIHDYFFAKSMDKVRVGGVVAFITSKGTMDKQGEDVRKYLGERADLIGAIRLPNDAFKANAGTEVTSDILFLQKRERLAVVEPDWVKLGENEDGILMNQYFVDNPHMILGKMEMVSGRFGDESTCTPLENVSLEEQLAVAIGNLDEVTLENGLVQEIEREMDTAAMVVPSDPDVRNFSYTVLDDEIYFRENSTMRKQEFAKGEDADRIIALIELRDHTRELIKFQSEDYSDEVIKDSQVELNELYDSFATKYGRINERRNQRAFEEDSSYPLLASLEKMDAQNKFEDKADIFFKRTIRQHIVITEVDTANEALALSINEKAKVDLEYMAELTGKDQEEIIKDLKGVIYLNPNGNEYETANDYLSGNIRQKLDESEMAKMDLERTLKKINDVYPVDEEEKLRVLEKMVDFELNIEALEQVMPEDLTAGEITARLGATWIPSSDVQDFVYETLETPYFHKFDMKVKFAEGTSVWNISKKSDDAGNVLATSKYGTSRINAYRIIEDSLNLKDVRIMDSHVDHNGNTIRVLNHKETTLAQQKQDALKERFSEWLWEEPERRNRLLKMYNEKFNSVRTREYDGGHLTFPGMNPEINLKGHQKDVVAHTLYGGNTLMAHVVGSGKTFSCIASAMESKRLGLAQKSLIVVPNHLTEQWGADFLELYPSANILVATKKDFQPANRKKFCGRIATGDYDAVIIGHTQFERIPLSEERQKMEIKKQIDDITNNLAEMKYEIGQNFSVKEAEKTKKALDVRLKKLNDQSNKDDVVTFEELGVDRLFVDEAHSFKNLFLYTKMQNVAGIGNREAKKSSDMFMKCRYMDEITGGKGIVFATGTPISNSMTELYTMQRYLQYDKLEELGLENFDSWASTFGESVTAIELAPEGSGFRSKTRFAKFYNIPELMSVFKETADIQTADMLDLPVPEAELKVVVTKPSELQVDMVASLAERADMVRSKSVDPTVDNMLKITNDGRKLALDQRLMNPDLPDDENSKVWECVRNVHEIWEESKENRSTQLLFCDLSTPKKDGSFSVYDDIKEKLLAKGIPESEIAFIHDANTDKQKDTLFAKVRTGEIRVLMGSTEKMGAGTNVQDKLIALHDLDCPWRPSDLEQRMGRIVRQGNENEKVQVLRYVTENTFDSYSYQLIENKQKFISQIMTSKSPVRSADDVDDSTLSYAEIKALATGNPLIKEKMDLDMQVTKLRMLKSSFIGEKHKLEDNLTQHYPKRIMELNESISAVGKDIEHTKVNTTLSGDSTFSRMKVLDKLYQVKEDAGAAIMDAMAKVTNSSRSLLGQYRGMQMDLVFDKYGNDFVLGLKNESSYKVKLGENGPGNITRIDNLIKSLPDHLVDLENELVNTERQIENAKIEVAKPFAYEEELLEKQDRLEELDKELSGASEGLEEELEAGDLEKDVKKKREFER